jgi:hypothetical protein
LLLRPPRDLVCEQAFEQLDGGPLPVDGLPVAGGQGGQDAKQPERLPLLAFTGGAWPGGTPGACCPPTRAQWR